MRMMNPDAHAVDTLFDAPNGVAASIRPLEFGVSLLNARPTNSISIVVVVVRRALTGYRSDADDP